MGSHDGKELPMKEEIRQKRMQEHGCITWCEQENTMCFGCLTENGDCKYITCLHYDPNWIAQQERIEAKRRETEKPKAIETPEKVSRRETETPAQEIRRKWEHLENKARALYQAGERNEAEKVMRKARKLRTELWNIEHDRR